MALQESFESSGNWLFRWRSYLPLALYGLAIPVVLLSESSVVLPMHDVTWWWVLCVIVGMLGQVIRGLTIGYTPRGTSGRNTSEGQVAESLNTKGIYGAVRHPLYLGNFFMWIGIVMFMGNPWFVLVVALGFWLYYERIMYAEEAFLRLKFGENYLVWANRTPAFWPRWGGWIPAEVSFSWKNVLKREYNGWFAMMMSLALVDQLHLFKHNGWMEFDQWLSPHWRIIALVSLVVFVVLRGMKKRTRWLDVQGREYIG